MKPCQVHLIDKMIMISDMPSQPFRDTSHQRMKVLRWLIQTILYAAKHRNICIICDGLSQHPMCHVQHYWQAAVMLMRQIGPLASLWQNLPEKGD